MIELEVLKKLRSLGKEARAIIARRLLACEMSDEAVGKGGFRTPSRPRRRRAMLLHRRPFSLYCQNNA